MFRRKKSKRNISSVLTARNILIVLTCALMGIFISAPDVYLPSVRNGLNLYVTAVLPSMLPFFFFSKLLTELDFAQSAGKVLRRPLRFLYHAPPVGGYILLMSMLCGYPVGAKLIGEFYEKNMISTDEAKKLVAFTLTSGPLFIVGAVGFGMFDSKSYGFILLLCHYIGTLLNGLIYRGKNVSTSEALPPSLSSADDLLNKTMLNTFLSVGLVGGFITIFNLFIDVAQQTGLIPLLAKGLAYLHVNARLSSGVVGGLLEMTKGCLMLSRSGFPILIVLPLCEFLITFGGACVTFQSLTFLSKTKISPAYYLSVKCTQGILCASLCFFVCLFLN